MLFENNIFCYIVGLQSAFRQFGHIRIEFPGNTGTPRHPRFPMRGRSHQDLDNPLCFGMHATHALTRYMLCYCLLCYCTAALDSFSNFVHNSYFLGHCCITEITSHPLFLGQGRWISYTNNVITICDYIKIGYIW